MTVPTWPCGSWLAWPQSTTTTRKIASGTFSVARWVDSASPTAWRPRPMIWIRILTSGCQSLSIWWGWIQSMIILMSKLMFVLHYIEIDNWLISFLFQGSSLVLWDLRMHCLRPIMLFPNFFESNFHVVLYNKFWFQFDFIHHKIHSNVNTL